MSYCPYCRMGTVYISALGDVSCLHCDWAGDISDLDDYEDEE
jgi:hypothetical protein